MKTLMKEICVFVSFSIFGAMCFAPLFIWHMISL